MLVPFQRPRLKKGAVPKHFPLSPSYLYPNRKRDRRIVKQYGSAQAVRHVPAILKKTVAPVETDNELVNEIDVPFTTVQDDSAVEKENIHHVTEDKETIQENSEDIFMDLHSQKENLTLNTYWAVFPCNDSFKKYILLSQMSVKNGIPMLERQLVVSESLELKYYFGKKEFKDVQQLPACATCKTDIEQAAKCFSELYFCYGGPPSHMYSEVIGITECAYIDTTSATWRHKNCTLFTNPLNSKQCAFCVSLYTRFKNNLQTVNRPRTRIRRKLMGNMLNNNSEAVIQRNKIERYKLIRAETRIRIQLEKLQSRVKELENDFWELSETSVEDKLRAMNVPEEQIVVITECINAAKCTDKRARRYSHQWIMTCILLYAESQDVYRYMHANNILPLCDIPTVRKYINHPEYQLIETLNGMVSESDET